VTVVEVRARGVAPAARAHARARLGVEHEREQRALAVRLREGLRDDDPRGCVPLVIATVPRARFAVPKVWPIEQLVLAQEVRVDLGKPETDITLSEDAGGRPVGEALEALRRGEESVRALLAFDSLRMDRPMGGYFEAYLSVRSRESGDQTEPLYVKAGEAVILNQSVVHYSVPNYSSKIRKAITAGIKSKGAPMIFHYNDLQKNDGKLEVFEMPEDFLISFDDFTKDISERPKLGESKGFIDYRLPNFKIEELKSMVTKMRTSAGFPATKDLV